MRVNFPEGVPRAPQQNAGIVSNKVAYLFAALVLYQIGSSFVASQYEKEQEAIKGVNTTTVIEPYREPGHRPLAEDIDFDL